MPKISHPGARVLLVAGLVVLTAPVAAQDPASPLTTELNGVRWGMSPRELTDFFAARIQERYREQIAEARDAIQEDRLREEQQLEERRLRRGYVRFDGQRAGWDVSFLQGEFTHRNRESMLAYRDEEGHQNYYFFIRGRLYKMFRAINDDRLARVPFDELSTALSRRYGDGSFQSEALPGGGRRRWTEWRDDTTRVRVIDERRFYGVYCLAWDELATVARLDELRTVEDTGEHGHTIVEAVTLPESGEDEGSGDQHRDVVDRITGVRIPPGEDDDDLQDLVD
jgi:hypothetical protein